MLAFVLLAVLASDPATCEELLEKHSCERAPAASEDDMKRAEVEYRAAYDERADAIDRCLPEYRSCRPTPEWEIFENAERAWNASRGARIACYQERWEGADTPEALLREINVVLLRARTAELRANVGRASARPGTG